MRTLEFRRTHGIGVGSRLPGIVHLKEYELNDTTQCFCYFCNIRPPAAKACLDTVREDLWVALQVVATLVLVDGLGVFNQSRQLWLEQSAAQQCSSSETLWEKWAETIRRISTWGGLLNWQFQEQWYFYWLHSKVLIFAQPPPSSSSAWMRM